MTSLVSPFCPFPHLDHVSIYSRYVIILHSAAAAACTSLFTPRSLDTFVRVLDPRLLFIPLHYQDFERMILRFLT